ncbi:hypothetical protein [Rhodococcus sp. Q]|uniref:hypothetical protein n=1 Tax=Rhodococcus sp. Q TaxID=2502252 RepID=UPI0010F9AE34|nr:hypothetical protein [Rhodococcus sp. Q]
MSEVYRTFSRHSAEIWSENYRLDQGVIMAADAGSDDGTINPQYLYTIGHPHPETLGTNPTSVDLPRELGLPPVYRIDDGPVLEKIRDESLIYEYEGAYAGVYSPHQQPGSRAYGADNRLLMLGYVHEWFHVFQGGDQFSQIPSESGGTTDLSTYPREPADVHGLALVEDCVLAEQADTHEEARDLLRTFLAIRATRWQTQPGVRDKEASGEQMEGLGRYVDDLFARYAGYKVVYEDDQQRSAEPKPLFVSIAAGRSYNTGSAIGRLLQQATGNSEWRTLVASGLTPSEAAARLLGEPAGAERERLVEQAKTDHSYSEQLKAVENANFPDLEFPKLSF